MAPTFGNGKICYVEVPAIDIAQSADFYSNVLGWQMRTRSDGAVAFDDGVGQVSGTFCKDRPAVATLGLCVHVMVDDIQATAKLVETHGGKIVERISNHGAEFYCKFKDPAGNVMGLYQQPT
jgi:uncharacterized protein